MRELPQCAHQARTVGPTNRSIWFEGYDERRQRTASLREIAVVFYFLLDLTIFTTLKVFETIPK